MSVLQILYQLLLEPLTLILETVYGAALNWMGSYGAAIIPLSLAVNFMLLPFYKRADAIQMEERETQKKMKAGLAHIKATFQGDERFMMQKTYYRQNNYKPVYSLRSLLPLVLEIPFFIAAYHFLSGVTAFQGEAFLFLTDLGEPDQLLTIGGISINILPILMTVINIISSEIYTHGAPIKDKIMLYGMAVVFLVLLYNSPSALVFYWTLNNVFSLVKNIIGRTSKPKLVRCITYSALGAGSVVYAMIGASQFSVGQIILFVIGILFQIPSVIGLIRWKAGPRKLTGKEVVGDTPIFRTSCVFLALLIGLLIPTATIVSSPAEFMLASNPQSPLIHVLPAMLVAAGLFVLWIGLFYYLSTPRIRGIFTVAAIVMSGMGIVNYLFFGTSMGTLLPLLQYEKTPSFTSNELTLNIEVILGVSLVLLILWLKKKEWLKRVLIAACVTVVGLSVYNGVRIQQQMPQVMQSFRQEEKAAGENHFTFTNGGKNVVVVMVDRAVNGLLPYLFNERPELKKQFDGFTWYPNTISYSNSTNTGSPAVYGGYDYRPEQMNERSDTLLVDKHNEALKTMPVVFLDNGYKVTVCDPPYANYNWNPDLSIFDDYPEINRFLTDSGQFRDTEGTDQEKTRIWRRNFFCFSVMKSAPLVLQSFLYQGGKYFDGQLIGRESSYVQTVEGLSKAWGYRDNFLDAYTGLCAYPELTQVEESSTNTFHMLYNSTAHNGALLKEPEYEPALEIDNTDFDKDNAERFTVDGRTYNVTDDRDMATYQCNMAAMIKLGEWFDDLREKGIWDNTRIIIVADHGAVADNFEDMVFGPSAHESAMNYHPQLLVKDFDSTGFETDYTFMTNADTPGLAFAGLIENPVSPFTGKAINSDDKAEAVHHIFYTNEWQTNLNNGKTFNSGLWLNLKSDNIFDMSSWENAGNTAK